MNHEPVVRQWFKIYEVYLNDIYKHRFRGTPVYESKGKPFIDFILPT